ncbi:hypothetical protein EPD60_00540 [Flaviaesturariibacter flavus]|uniref:Uncharacterized protein n=1 Tax=Flaviaesturariibacter flavus TaxID=2502780 RepID=A0A4R1BPM5_9BACT|nr:DUF6526 family protein [Flaviaesturariibacter flavus]TCJ19643.1 hypothetical protein EPD60_00540 [Flaviaesturariibacter flavus]
MAEQNYKNHSRLSSGYHGVTLGLIVIFVVGSIRYLVREETADKYPAVLFVLLSVILLLLFVFIRSFALKAQDRAIRAEESLRYFILTGKRLDPSLRVGQVIALRFASDEELPALAERALREQLGNKQIKEAIKSWRADYHRV